MSSPSASNCLDCRLGVSQMIVRICLPSSFCWVAQYFWSSSKYFLSMNSLFVPITDMELILGPREPGQRAGCWSHQVWSYHSNYRDLDGWYSTAHIHRQDQTVPQTCPPPAAGPQTLASHWSPGTTTVTPLVRPAQQ